MKKIFKYIKPAFLFLLFCLILSLSISFLPLKKSNYVSTAVNIRKVNLNEFGNIEQIFTSEYDVIDSLDFNYEAVSIKYEKPAIELEQKNSIYDLDFDVDIDIVNILEFKLYDYKNNLLYSNRMSIKSLSSEKIWHHKFKAIKDSKWKNFKFTIECINCDPESDIYIYVGNKNIYSGAMLIDDQNNDAMVKFSINGRIKSYIFVWLTLVLFVLYFSICIYKKLESKKISLNKYSFKVILLFEFIMSTIFSISLLKVIINSQYYGVIAYKYLFILVAGTLTLIIVFINEIKKNSKKICNLYLLIIIPISIFYMVFMLPNYIPDENHHYYKSYSVSTNIIEATNSNVVPSQILKYTNDMSFDTYKKLNEELEITTNYSETAVVKGRANNYNFVLYIPSSIGISLARILDLNIYTGYYIARFMNCLFMIILGYFSIKRIPFGKLVVFTYLLTPMIIQQGISLSADSLTNSFAIFFIANVLYLKKQNERITQLNLLLLFLNILFLFCAKQLYFPLSFFSIILLWRKTEKIDFKKFKLIVFSFFILLICYLIFSNLVNLYMNESPGLTIVDVIKQPMDYVFILIETLFLKGVVYVETFIGSDLGWLNISANKICIYIMLFLLLISPYIKNEESFLGNKSKIYMFFISLIVINIIFLGFYMVYPLYSQNTIYGIQGRYFIPIMLLPLLALVKKTDKFSISNIELKYSIVITIIHLITILRIIRFFL